MTNIVILTGAGVSAESGLSTFRDSGGLWEKYRLEDVASPQGFARDPDSVHAFYNARRAKAASVLPNAAHSAIAKLQRMRDHTVFLITQNVDNLHEKAGSPQVLHMHGQLDSALCGACDHRWPASTSLSVDDRCPSCAAHSVRPDIVWFGEMPYGLDQIETQLQNADIFAAIGTSGQVYPAAGFAQEAARSGAQLIAFNLNETDVAPHFDAAHIGPATQTVPAWVASLLQT
ncbi:NAD-dependent protein deacylase (plasmid) [Pseudoseohaeicola sp. NH-UV-7]|uniref:NAD-dependent deacylase n=1 Tax=Sulfitobacter sp. TBRI5 TaxID=2989732 RepID=UPI003A64D1C6